MIPWKIIVIDSFPLTVNGKIDRKALSYRLDLIFNDLCYKGSTFVCPGSPTEIFVHSIFLELLNINENCQVGIDINFNELGGHSLLVMEAVLRIRKHYKIHGFSPRQFLSCGTIRKIASFIDSSSNVDLSLNHVEWRPVFLDINKNIGLGYRVSVVKALSILFFWVSLWVSLLPSIVLLAKALDSRASKNELVSAYVEYIVLVCLSMAVVLLCFISMSWVLCRLLQTFISKDQPVIRGDSLQFLLWYNFDRFWYMTGSFVEHVFGGTIFLPLFCKLYGANIGGNNFMEDIAKLRLPFMLTTGNNVVVQSQTRLQTVELLANGDVLIGEIVLGENVVVGPNAHVGLGSNVQASSIIKSLSIVPDNSIIDPGTIIEGTEVKATDKTNEYTNAVELVTEDQHASFVHHILFLFTLQIPSVIFLLFVIAMLIGILQLSTDQNVNAYWILMLIGSYPLIVTVGQLLTGIFIRALRRHLNRGRAQPRRTILYSRRFLRQLLASKLYQSTINLMPRTVVTMWISRLMGADLDIHSPFSPLPEEPDLTFIGKNVFCANGVKLRNLCFYPGGIAKFGKIDIGAFSMVLDRSVVETNCVIDENVLVASLTTVTEKVDKFRGSLLIGTPAIHMINSNQNETQHDMYESTYRAVFKYLLNVYFDVIFVSIPVLASFYCNVYVYWMIHQSDYALLHTFGISFAMLPVSLGICILWLLGICLASKWLLIGNFDRLVRREVMNVDDPIFFRWELVNYFVHTASSLPLQFVNEYWLTAIFWRLMGAKIGQRTMIDPNVLLLEADLLQVGNDCHIKEEATLLCHKFSNGGLEFASIVIPSKTIIRERAVILPGCEFLDENVELMPLTHVLPSEKLTAGRWHGSPAEKVDIEWGK